jgi:hypothetical protein
MDFSDQRSEQRPELFKQIGKLCFDHIPNRFRVQTVIPVDQNISKSNNIAVLGYLVSRFGTETVQLGNRFADDLQLTLNRGTKGTIILVIIHCFARRKIK